MAENFLIQMEGLGGESKITGHDDGTWTQIDNWSWTGSQLGTWHQGGGGGGGKANVGDVSISKQMDASSPTLYSKCMKGEHINKVTLHCLRAGGDQMVYFEMVMNKVIVSSIGWSGAGELPYESLLFNFKDATWEWKVQEESGVAGAGNKKMWDVSKNAES